MSASIGGWGHWRLGSLLGTWIGWEKVPLGPLQSGCLVPMEMFPQVRQVLAMLSDRFFPHGWGLMPVQGPRVWVSRMPWCLGPGSDLGCAGN